MGESGGLGWGLLTVRFVGLAGRWRALAVALLPAVFAVARYATAGAIRGRLVEHVGLGRRLVLLRPPAQV